jgi:hypothetical protein
VGRAITKLQYQRYAIIIHNPTAKISKRPKGRVSHVQEKLAPQARYWLFWRGHLCAMPIILRGRVEVEPLSCVGLNNVHSLMLRTRFALDLEVIIGEVVAESLMSMRQAAAKRGNMAMAATAKPKARMQAM